MWILFKLATLCKSSGRPLSFGQSRSNRRLKGRHQNELIIFDLNVVTKVSYVEGPTFHIAHANVVTKVSYDVEQLKLWEKKTLHSSHLFLGVLYRYSLLRDCICTSNLKN
jgi:hypothetical protein